MMVVAELTTQEDEARRLLSRIAARDRAAFEDFYRSYARRVLAFVRDIVSSAELAEEAAADVMVAVWRSAGTYRGGSRVTTWLLGIAHHKALDALRRQDREHASLEADIQRRAVAGPSTDDLGRIEQQLSLTAALRELSIEHRTVLVLAFGFGCSQSEIAAIVGCPAATVKTRTFYAKRKLREALDRAAAAEELE